MQNYSVVSGAKDLTNTAMYYISNKKACQVSLGGAA
jgi:hypothetical protein